LANAFEESIDESIYHEEEKNANRSAIYKIIWEKETATHPDSSGETPERYEEPIDNDLANLLLASHNNGFRRYLPKRMPPKSPLPKSPLPLNIFNPETHQEKSC
jgi:hypothetical protein